MSNDLERRLEAMLADAPEPEAGAGEEALHRALQALRPAAAPRRAVRAGVLAFAATVILLVIAAGSLAAAGALHVSLGSKPKSKPRAVTQLVRPSGADGIAVLEDGYLSVVTKSGFRLQGLAVSAAGLSPHALYVAAGVGDSLVAMAPNGRRAWSHPAGGSITAISWAPDGLRIAYVVRVGRRCALHVIWGNGLHDTVIDRSVRALAPSWRADSLAVAYVGGGGSPAVYDLAHESRTPVSARGPASGVAFAPSGTALAVATARTVSLDGRVVARGPNGPFGWTNGWLAVAVPRRIRFFAPSGAPRGSQAQHGGTVVAMTPKLIVVERGWQLVAGDTVLLTLTPETVPQDVEIR